MEKGAKLSITLNIVSWRSFNILNSKDTSGDILDFIYGQQIP